MLTTTMLASVSFCLIMTAVGAVLTAQQFKKTVTSKR